MQELENKPDHNKATILTVPSVEGDEKPFFAPALEHFSADILRKNLLMIRSLLEEIDPNDLKSNTKRSDFLAKRQLLFDTTNDIERFVRSINKAEETRAIVARQRPEAILLTSELSLAIKELQELLEAKLRELQGNVVVLSPSHATSYAEIHAAVAVSRENGHFGENDRVGMIIFDEHTDFYRSEKSGIPAVSLKKILESEKMFDTDSAGYDYERIQRVNNWVFSGLMYGVASVAKRNFLTHLLEEETIVSVCIVGPSSRSTGIATVEGLTRNYTYDYFVDRQSRIKIVGLPSRNGSETSSLKRTEMREEVVRQVIEMKQQGITHIIFSVDLDVLQSEKGYTAFDYNAYAYLINLGLNDMQQEYDALLNELISIEQDSEMRANKLYAFFDKMLYTNQESANPGSQVGKVKVKEAGGLPAGLVGQLIDAVKQTCEVQDIQIGIQLSQGRFVGDVVELSGKDAGGYTTKVALGIADRMAS